MDHNSTLELLIKLGVVGQADVRAANELMAETAAATGKGAGANTGLADSAGKAAEATAELGLKQQELKKVLQEVGNTVAPGAGRALMHMVTGPVGAAVALVGVFHMVQESVRELNEELDRLAAEAAKPLGGGVESYKKSIDEAMVALGKFQAALKAAGADADPIKTQLDRQKQLVEAQIAAENKKRAALGLPPVEPLRDSSVLNAEISDREAAQPGLEADAAGKRAAANEAGRKLEEERTAIGILRKQLGIGGSDYTFDSETKKLDELFAERDARKKQFEGAKAWGNESVAAVANREIINLDEEINLINLARERRRKLLGQLEGGLEGRSETAATTAIDADRAEQLAKLNQGRLRQLPGELTQAEKIEGVNDEAARAVSIINTTGQATNHTLGQLLVETGKTQQQQQNIISSLVAGQLDLRRVISQLEAQLARATANTNLH